MFIICVHLSDFISVVTWMWVYVILSRHLKSFLTVPDPGQHVFVWCILSLCLLFFPVLALAVLIAVCLAVPIHFGHSEFFSQAFKRWGVFLSQINDIILQCDSLWSFLPMTSTWIFLSTLSAVAQWFPHCDSVASCHNLSVVTSALNPVPWLEVREELVQLIRQSWCSPFYPGCASVYIDLILGLNWFWMMAS